MSFGKRGAVPPNFVRPKSQKLDAAASQTVKAPPSHLADEATYIPAQVKQFAWSSLVAILLALGYVAWNHAIADAISNGDARAAAQAGRPLMPYALLRGASATMWTFGGCTLRSEAFPQRDDHRLVFNNIGKLESEETLEALSTAAGFMSCIARKSNKELCDTDIRARLVADVTMFYARHSRTSKLVDGMSATSGGGLYGAGTGRMAGINPII